MAPLLSARTPAAQVVIAVVVPAVFGAICGLAVEGSKGIYLLLQLIALIGGVAAGVLDHERVGEAAVRGLISGAVFGSFILIAHRLSGGVAQSSLPDPQVTLVVITAIGGALLAAVGCAVGGRRRRRAVSAT